jgi:hypothetical protein
MSQEGIPTEEQVSTVESGFLSELRQAESDAPTPATESRILKTAKAVLGVVGLIAVGIYVKTELLPKNWSTIYPYEDLASIAAEHGIPLTWVTPQETIEKLRKTTSLDEREEILVEDRDFILALCDEELQKVRRPDLAGMRGLLLDSVDALRGGHSAPVQALAVCVLDGLLTLDGHSSRSAKKLGKELSEHVRVDQLTRLVTLAPLGVVFTAWQPGQNDPAPRILSRHVTVHATAPEHFTEVNALRAVMVASSLLVSRSRPQLDLGMDNWPTPYSR